MAKGTLNITSDGIGSADITDASISTADLADTTIVTLTCGTTNTNTTVTAASTTGMIVGAAVSGAGIPALATVISIITNTSFVLSAAATATASVTLTFDSGVTSKKLAQNLTLTGDYVGIPAATTTQRDALTAATGMLIYNSSIGMMQQNNAQGWASIDSPPTVSSLNYPGDDTALDTVGEFNDVTCDYNNDPTIAHDTNSNMKVGMSVSGTGIPVGATIASVTSTTAFELSASTTGGAVTNGTLTFNTQTLIITGTNFQTGATVTIDGTAPSTVTRNSSTQITVTGTPAKTAGTKLDGLVVSNTSGLAASINVDYSALPAWTTTSGTVLSTYQGITISTIDLAATSATSYAITSGALPGGLAMSTSTGDITGTISSATSTFNFTVTATDAEAQSAPRLFNIINNGLPTGSGGLLETYSGYRVHIFGDTSPPAAMGTTVVVFTANGPLTADIMIVAGGGGGSAGPTHLGNGGSGAGAGGVLVLASQSLGAGTYNITVGGGGSGGVYGGAGAVNAANAPWGRQGVNSSVINNSAASYSKTAYGGGHGSNENDNTLRASMHGGSGGGTNQTSVTYHNYGRGTYSGSSAGSPYNVDPRQGYDGAPSGGASISGGGGGRGEAGNTNGNGHGGDGLANLYRTGSNITYGGGGGGCGYTSGSGPGGSGGGGAGNHSGNGVAGTAKLGGGGGGGQDYNAAGNGGAGGSGIVILRYAA